MTSCSPDSHVLLAILSPNCRICAIIPRFKIFHLALERVRNCFGHFWSNIMLPSLAEEICNNRYRNCFNRKFLESNILWPSLIEKSSKTFRNIVLKFLKKHFVTLYKKVLHEAINKKCFGSFWNTFSDLNLFSFLRLNNLLKALPATWNSPFLPISKFDHCIQSQGEKRLWFKFIVFKVFCWVTVNFVLTLRCDDWYQLKSTPPRLDSPTAIPILSYPTRVRRVSRTTAKQWVLLESWLVDICIDFYGYTYVRYWQTYLLWVRLPLALDYVKRFEGQSVLNTSLYWNARLKLSHHKFDFNLYGDWGVPNKLVKP